MAEFDSLAAFADELGAMEGRLAGGIAPGLSALSAELLEKARGRVGHYQDAAGPFPAWAALARSTEAEKRRLGYRPDAPLERSGAMRERFDFDVEGTQAVVGSPDQVAVWHETGTPRMPAREVFGPTAVVDGPGAVERFARRLIGVMLGIDEEGI